VVVSNSGPSDVTNARVQDALPARWRVRLDLHRERRGCVVRHADGQRQTSTRW
jgi:hypothetical protein